MAPEAVPSLIGILATPLCDLTWPMAGNWPLSAPPPFLLFSSVQCPSQIHQKWIFNFEEVMWRIIYNIKVLPAIEQVSMAQLTMDAVTLHST
jgi:hypothetical protein